MRAADIPIVCPWCKATSPLHTRDEWLDHVLTARAMDEFVGYKEVWIPSNVIAALERSVGHPLTEGELTRIADRHLEGRDAAS